MPHCAVIWCNNQSKNLNRHNSGISYHKFPKDPDIKLKWIIATGKYDWLPQKHDSICSFHFDAGSYVAGRQRAILSSDACPTLNLHPLFNETDCITTEDTRVESPSEALQEDTSNQPPPESLPQEKPKAPKTSNVHTARIRKLKLYLMNARKIIKSHRVRMKVLRKTNRRLSKKIGIMNMIIKHLRAQSGVTVIVCE